MFEMKPIARHMLLACGGLASALMLAGPVAAQQTQPPTQEQKLERVTITGSNVKRTDADTAAAVTIIIADQIRRSGRQSIAKVLGNYRCVAIANPGCLADNFFAARVA